MSETLLKFFSKYFNCEEAEAALRFFYNPEDCLWIYDNLKRVCDEGKQIMFLNNIHNNDLEKYPLPSPLWNIVFDMPKEAVKPTIIFNTDWLALCNENARIVRMNMSEEIYDVKFGLGLIVKNSYTGLKEYFPICCLVIENSKEMKE